MDMGIKGKVAVISGGSTGIGAAVALRLATEGACVVVCARDAGRLKATAENIKKATGGDVRAIDGDCTRDADVTRLIDATVSAFGTVDILVNSVAGPKTAEFFALSDQDWMESFNLKLMGQIRCARAVFPHMVKKKWGRIVNIIGTHGHQPHAYLMTAGIVNAGLLNFTKALAELGAPHGILVNAVNPGPIETERMQYVLQAKHEQFNVSVEEARRQWEQGTLLKRFGRPDEIAAAVVFLASEVSSYITGASIDIDGGQTKGV
jgi:NAD(P)-dependent dehydrogenase (short-subunit alcohol dehydrogenase family)